MAFFLGMAVYFARQGSVLDIAVTFVAAFGSLLVSYARARAEGLGLECKVGLMERPERLLVLILASAGGLILIRPALWILGVLTHATALQRVRHVQLSLRGRAE
jgi:CDP-diacylglycerol--glycerol-3-phosphate 3-phosphatidyltransferase